MSFRDSLKYEVNKRDAYGGSTVGTSTVGNGDLNFDGVLLSDSDTLLHLNTHRIVSSGKEYSCETCGREMEVPEMFQDTGKYEQIYRMYILGKFATNECRDITEFGEESGVPAPNGDVPYKPVNPDNIYWMENNNVIDNGNTYTVQADSLTKDQKKKLERKLKNELESKDLSSRMY